MAANIIYCPKKIIFFKYPDNFLKIPAEKNYLTDEIVKNKLNFSCYLDENDFFKIAILRQVQTILYMEELMDCVFCGNEIAGRPIRQDGHVYCSIDCADTASEVGIDEDEYGMEEYQDDNLDMDFYEEAIEY